MKTPDPPSNPDLDWPAQRTEKPENTENAQKLLDNACVEAHAVITRSQKLAEDRPLKKLKVPDKIPDVLEAEIQREQTTDPSLAERENLQQQMMRNVINIAFV